MFEIMSVNSKLRCYEGEDTTVFTLNIRKQCMDKLCTPLLRRLDTLGRFFQHFYKVDNF